MVSGQVEVGGNRKDKKGRTTPTRGKGCGRLSAQARGTACCIYLTFLSEWASFQAPLSFYFHTSRALVTPPPSSPAYAVFNTERQVRTSDDFDDHPSAAPFRVDPAVVSNAHRVFADAGFGSFGSGSASAGITSRTST